MQHFAPIVFAGLLALMAGPSVEAADLRVDIHGISGGSGMVYAAVFKREEDFLKVDKAAATAMAGATSPVASLVFAGLAPGHYAVSVYHDHNNNGRLDSNLMGVPSEPFGFSSDAAGLMGAPKFADAAIRIDAADVAIRINLR